MPAQAQVAAWVLPGRERRGGPSRFCRFWAETVKNEPVSHFSFSWKIENANWLKRKIEKGKTSLFLYCSFGPKRQGGPRPTGKTLASFFPVLSLSSPLSLFSSAQRSRNRATSRRNSGAESPGAVAGPLAGVRAPQRVSAPPSSGLAATPLWPDPGELCPPDRPFPFPMRRRARRRGKLSGFPSSPFPLPYFSFLLGSDSIWGRGLELGLGFRQVRV